jgi:hypothetical protein
VEVRSILIHTLTQEVKFTVTDTDGCEMASALLKLATFPELNKYCEVLFTNAIV